MPLTTEQRIENLAKARAARKAKFEASLAAAVPPTVAAELAADAAAESELDEPAAPIVPQRIRGEIKLQSLDARFLQVCIGNQCWDGRTIIINKSNVNALQASMTEKGRESTLTIEGLAKQVMQTLREGGYLFMEV